MLGPKIKKSDSNTNIDISRQLGSQYIQIFKILEKMKDMDERISQNQELLIELNKKYTRMKNKKVKSIPYKTKTKEAIKLILKKQGKLSSNQLCKLIGLSRTRCNEYLRRLEMEGDAVGEIIERKKYYRLKK
jgi:biotin operon repressor